jgi:hypothetical protein
LAGRAANDHEALGDVDVLSDVAKDGVSTHIGVVRLDRGRAVVDRPDDAETSPLEPQ